MNRINIKGLSSTLLLGRPFFTLACLIITSMIIYRINKQLTIILSIFILICFVYVYIKERNYVYLILLVSMYVLFIAFTIYFSVYSSKIETQNSEFYDKKVSIVGKAVTLPELDNGTISVIIKPEKIIYNGKEYISPNRDKIILYIKCLDEITFNYGDSLKISGSLKKPEKQNYKGGFDFAKNLYRKQVSAIVFSTSQQTEVYDTGNSKGIIYFGMSIRKEILNIIYDIFPEKEGGLLAGMLIGERKGLEKEVQEAFMKSGLLHIMAVSGANILFIMAPIMFILKKLSIKRFVSIPITTFAIILFVLITGFEPSIVRAAIMAIVFLAGKMIFRNYDLFSGISVAALIMLILNPYNLFDAGFLLSFSAVLSIGLFYKKIEMAFGKIQKHIKEALSAVCAVQLGVVPLGGILFNSFSPISFITNVLVVPVTALITILGFLIIFIGIVSVEIAKVIAIPCIYLLKYVLLVVKVSTGYKMALISIITPSFIIIVIYYIFLIWLFKSSLDIKKIIKISVYFAVVLFVMAVFLKILPQNAEVHIINVGQGDMIYLKTTNDKKILIDSGPESGEDILIPFLLDNGVKELDIVFLTHAHEDHINGMNELLDYYKIKILALPYYKNVAVDFKDIILHAQEKNILIEYISEGDEVKMGKDYFYAVNPQNENVDKEITLNNTSIVLKYTYDNFCMLFSGDIESDIEERILEDNKSIKVDVLKVAHHGSNTSSSISFLEAVEPDIAAISVGKNSFGHPDENVIQIMRDMGMRVFRTDINSEITIRTNGQKYSVETLYN